MTFSPPNGGLTVMADAFMVTHRAEITLLAARYRLPAVYSARVLTELGGLLSSAGGQRDETSRLFSMAAALAARFDPPGSRHVAAAIDSVGWSHAASRPARLSAREAEVLQLLADGLTNREIADRLVLSERTVDRHVANAYTKIGAHSRAEATRFAVEYLH